MGDHTLLTDDELEEAIRAYEAMEWTPLMDERLGALIEERRARGASIAYALPNGRFARRWKFPLNH